LAERVEHRRGDPSATGRERRALLRATVPNRDRVSGIDESVHERRTHAPRAQHSYAKSGDLLQEILVDNVIRIVKFRDGYLVFTGIAHMVTDRGEVVFLKRDRDGWRVAHRLDVTGMPRAFLDESEGSMLVATDDRIVRVTNGRRVEVLYGNRHRFWEAHSIVKDPDGTLYLGARYIVVRLRPRAVGYAETWLAPEGATRPRPPTE
jgi:hypothetical protein